MLSSVDRYAVLMTEDYRNPTIIFKKDCYVIKHFSYTCARLRDGQGRPCGISHGSIVNIELRVDSLRMLKTFYLYLTQMQANNFSLIFNPIFSTDGHLESHDQTIIARGYVVDVVDTFTTEEKEANKTIMAKIQILLSSIIYTCADNCREHVISQ